MPRKRRTPKEGQVGASSNISNLQPSLPVANERSSQQASGGHSRSPSSLHQVSEEMLPPERHQTLLVQDVGPRYPSRSGATLSIPSLPQPVTIPKPSYTETKGAQNLRASNLPIQNIPLSKFSSVNITTDPTNSIVSQQLAGTPISDHPPVACTVQFGSMTLEGLSTSTKEDPSYPEIIASPPASSKSYRFPDRPGRGKLGTKCVVKANHFLAELPNKDIHHYDVSITPEVKSIGFNRAIMQQLVTLYRDSELGQRLPVYDGRKSIYTAGSLPFQIREFTINFQEQGDHGQTESSRKQQFKVVIKFAARVDLHHLGQFLSGRQRDAPQEALQALDIVLRELPTRIFTPIMRSFYSPNLGRPQSLGGGLSSWKGFYQSLRPTEMGLSLNIDISTHAFIEALSVIDFVRKLLNKDSDNFSNDDRKKIKKTLQGVKIQVNHTINRKRTYRIRGLTLQLTEDLRFIVDADNGTMKSVIQYFQETYSYTIMNKKLPCLEVGTAQAPKYLPMEVCNIVEGQCYTKNLSERQRAALVKGACQKPRDREESILQTVKRNAYQNDQYCKEFGIRVKDSLEFIEARVLPTPKLKYSNEGQEKDCSPRFGEWNMKNKRMYTAGKVDFWACINFSHTVDENQARHFCKELARTCQQHGMNFRDDPVMMHRALPGNVERALKGICFEQSSKKKRELNLLIAILPDENGSLYADLKRICETELDVISQCCLSKFVFTPKVQYLANVALKINVKVGGVNNILYDAFSRRIPLVSDIPTIIFGADVTHPRLGEDSTPSIAAVVASTNWPFVTSYAGRVNAQAHRQELIQDLFTSWADPVHGQQTGGMIKELMIAFYKKTGRKPERIIFFRDGVSEGQFHQVLLYEMDAIHKACASLGSDYQPPVTFVVVQKRHHTRLFASNHNDKHSVDFSGNIRPGTVVDSKICHPAEFDFYLCSHAGIQGTSRPAHYHVLWDDNNFTADSLQSLTNNLCYTFARCTRSVSIVPPAYYAHLAAARARKYMNLDSGSTSDSGSISRGGRAVPASVPTIQPNVKNVMFYC